MPGIPWNTPHTWKNENCFLNQVDVAGPVLLPEVESDLLAVEVLAEDSLDLEPESELLSLFDDSDLPASAPDESDFAASPPDLLPLLVVSDFSAGLEPLFLKSVAYQPEPLS